jgi:hypothetical protein
MKNEESYLNDFAKKKNKEEIEAVKKMKENPFTLEECIAQQERITERTAKHIKELSKVKRDL